MIFLLCVVVFALVAGYAAGGRLRNFERLRLRAWWLAPLGLILQVQVPAVWHPSTTLSVALLILSYGLLLVFAALNLRLAGFVPMFIGLALNLTVVSANHGMPVTRRALEASGQGSFLSELVHGKGAKHHLAGPDAVLLPLADVIPIPPPIAQVVSAGDLMVYGGVVWLVAATMRGRPQLWKPRRRKEQPQGRDREAIGVAGESDAPSVSIIGDYAEGPYGPVILLELASVEAVRWLHGAFLEMAKGSGPLALSSQPGVAFRRLGELELRLGQAESTKHLHRSNTGTRTHFVWSCSGPEWERHALFLEPFLEGGMGHQYLTDGAVDDAILEVSHGESHFSP